MRLHIGPVPLDEEFHPEEGGWRRLKEPAFGHLLLLSVPLSVLLAAGMLAAWGALARLHGVAGSGDVVVTPAGLLTAVAALVALIVGHELLHAASLPGFGLTPATTVGFWPRTVTPYVAHMGELSRNRFATVGLMPFLLLSLLPLLAGGLFGWMPAWAVALSTLNALLSSGDLIGAVLLLAQTSPSATVRNQGLETWWRPVLRVGELV